jgi:hypothetical protein
MRRVIIGSIAILSLIDIVCTGIGINSGQVWEANPWARALLNWSVPGACIIFAGLIAIQLAIIYRYFNKFKWIPYVCCVTIGIKLMVVYLHYMWICIL